ncbi:MAG TPA: hypothetical protein VNI36_06350 [Candidatus Dormibacteraeota bacterium]|nr:hypothetical protein [Candidatus Dormibacteraeota bacterium]
MPDHAPDRTHEVFRQSGALRFSAAEIFKSLFAFSKSKNQIGLPAPDSPYSRGQKNVPATTLTSFRLPQNICQGPDAGSIAFLHSKKPGVPTRRTYGETD